MRLRRPAALAVSALALASVATIAPTAQAATTPYTVTTLHFLTHIGPKSDQACDVVGDLYLPRTASRTHRVPAILATNGFGGSKDDQAGLAKFFAGRGYVFLSYSGLGFGGSGCKITLDDPDYDGKAASQLISYLGGAPGIAFTDAKHTKAAPVLNDVVHDARDHAGRAQKYDPRVGMVGGSYGGGAQFAAAADDPRLDTIVPFITWNDLSYSLGPNNTGQTSGVSTATPGATKLTWGLAFSGEGVADGFENAAGDPSRLYGCPNFATFVCPALVTAGSTGYFQPSAIAALRHASVAGFMSRIRIPTLLVQGENDTLFNLNEAIATYRALVKQRTPVKMIWQSWGHSSSTPAPGEIDLAAPNATTQYETARVAAWFDHYLRGSDVSTGPGFAYYRDWVTYSGIATPAYATAKSYATVTAATYHLSGDEQLVTTGATAGTQQFVTPPAGAPTSLNPVDVVGSYLKGLPQADLPGTYGTWTGPALTRNLDVAGSPVATLKVSAPTAVSASPATQLVLFVKVLDVDPAGNATLIHGLEAPVRIADATKPFTVTLPGIVHRFAVGHHVRLVVAGGSDNYRAGLVPTPVTIAGGTSQTLTLPTVG